MGKCIVLVLDGLGVGELPDASLYNDKGSNTMYKISCAKKLNIPNLLSLGLGNVSLLKNVLFNGVVIGSYGKMEEKSAGKDSTTGHWEIAGLILDKPFPVFHSFPDTIINSFIEKTGINGILGNYPASGTEIINKLGDEHYKTKMPIIYTSADSVFQVAASEEVFGLNNLYHLCEVARNEILVGEYAVARVIARPFIKEGNTYVRTANRRDFSLKPFNRTMLNYMQDFGIKTYGIGKIDDLFAGYGLDITLHTKSNSEGIETTINLIKDIKSGFIFVNLVDFDMLYGHRNDALGFAEALEYFDYKLSEIISSLDEKDLLIITADHGNDPADISTDHTREYVPLLVYSKEHKNPKNLGVRSSFCDVAKTVLEYYNIENSLFGESFLKYLN
ncbi:MAG TPA: phosphopentomutase [Bacteroidota bacterium]|nr:phosphopentomutase [Bacteroidota bacterium]